MIVQKNKSHKSLPKTQELRQRVNYMQKTKGYTFYSKRIASSSKFFSIDSRQMVTEPSKFMNFQSSKTLIRNKSRSSSNSLLKNAKQTKNQTFLVRKGQNYSTNELLATTKTTKGLRQKNIGTSQSKQQVLKIMQRLRVNNKLKIGQSTKYKLKDNFTQRMLKQKKQNMISTSRIDINQLIDDKNSQFNLNINLQPNHQKQIKEKQKNLKSLQSTLRQKQVELQSKQKNLKEKQQFIQNIIKEQAQNQKKKQVEITKKEKQIKEKQKNIKLEQEKLAKFEQESLIKIQQEKAAIYQQAKRKLMLQQKNKFQAQRQIQTKNIQKEIQKSGENKQIRSMNKKNQSIQKQLNSNRQNVYAKNNTSNRYQEMHSSSGIDLDDIQQIKIADSKPTHKDNVRKQSNSSVQNLNQTPKFVQLNDKKTPQVTSQKQLLREQFQNLFLQVQMVTSIGQVPYYCSTSLKKSKYSWQLSCLLLYKYSYDKFLSLEELLTKLVKANLEKQQTLNAKIQENQAIKGNLLKIKKSVQKKLTLSPKIANFLNLQKSLTVKQREQFVICIYKQVQQMCDQYLQDRKPQSADIESCYLRIVNSILIIQEIEFKSKYQQSVIQQISQVNQRQLFEKLNIYAKKVKEIARKRGT